MFVGIAAAALAAEPTFNEGEVVDRVLAQVGRVSGGQIAGGRVATGGENAALDLNGDGFLDRAEMLHWLTDEAPRERLAARTLRQAAGDPGKILLLFVDIGGFARGFPLAVRFDGGETLMWYDNGQTPDSVAGDSVFGTLLPKPTHPSVELVVMTNNATWSGVISVPFATSTVPTPVELYPNGTIGVPEMRAAAGRGKPKDVPSVSQFGQPATPVHPQPGATNLPVAAKPTVPPWVPWAVGLTGLGGVSAMFLRKRASAK